MKSAKASGTLGWMALAVVASPFAVAADENWVDSNWYGGINIGQSRATIDEPRITSNLLTSGFTGVSIIDDNRDTGFKLYGGYRINRNFAVEGGFFDLGKFGFTATTVPPGALHGDIRLRGIHLDAVGILPLTEQFSVFGRVGVNHAQARTSFRGTGAVTVAHPNPRQNDTHLKFGLGIQYDFTPSLGMRLEAERYRINDAVGNIGDIDLISVGLVYRFGGGPAPVPRAAAPAFVAAAPAPQPVVVAPPPPPPPPPPVVVTPPPPPPPVLVTPPPLRRVTFSADALFAFDQSTMTPAGKQQLDILAADLRSVNYDVIMVTGHTDRLGSNAYNMALSERRAASVKTYLVDAAGLPAGKITARGAGESDPVTQPGACVGQRATPSLIACLQPDRRVEVEVTGTR